MERKKGIYDLVYYDTRTKSETRITGADWKKIQGHLNTDYKDFMSVKDLEHTTDPFFKIVTSTATKGNVKEKEEYFYIKRK